MAIDQGRAQHQSAHESGGVSANPDLDGIQVGVQRKQKVSMDLVVRLDPQTLETVCTKITQDSYLA